MPSFTEPCLHCVLRVSRAVRRFRAIALAGAALWLGAFAVAAASAHPHTYIDAELGIDLDDEGIAGLRLRWTPLYAFGEDIVRRYDADGDGRFDPAETVAARDGAFEAIAAYHYFIRVNVDGKEYRPERVAGFSVESFRGRASFSFELPCRIGAGDGREVEIFLRDESCYVSFALLYVDDGAVDGISTALELYRDGSTYSHGSPLGAQRAILTLSPADGRRRSAFVEGLEQVDELVPAPTETHSNPFVRPGRGLEALPEGNPFLSAP